MYVINNYFFLERIGDNMKKRKMKNSIKVLLVIVIIIFLANFISSNSYLIYRGIDKILNNNNTINENIITTEDTKDILKEMAKSDSRINKILENYDKYPEVLLEMLSRNSDMTDYVVNYLDKKSTVTADNIGKVKKGDFPLLLQYDERWGYGVYGDSVIAISGCGPTVISMVIAGLTGNNSITPYDVAKYSEGNGYYDSLAGTSWSLFTEGVSEYGIKGTTISLSKSIMMNELENGHPIACSMRKGDFTTTGHIILITGVKDGKFIINDPNSKERSQKLWDYETLEPQIRNLWSFEIS